MHHHCKKVTAFAHITESLSIHGKTKVANFLVLSIPRYWIQTLAAPMSFHRAIKQSVDRVLWTNARTGRKLQWVKHPEVPLKGDTTEGPHLGLGLLDWNWKNHVKAIQAKWMLNYMDARQAQWKQILDAWFCRTNLGRAAVVADVPTHKLTDGLKGQTLPRHRHPAAGEGTHGCCAPAVGRAPQRSARRAGGRPARRRRGMM